MDGQDNQVQQDNQVPQQDFTTNDLVKLLIQQQQQQQQQMQQQQQYQQIMYQEQQQQVKMLMHQQQMLQSIVQSSISSEASTSKSVQNEKLDDTALINTLSQAIREFEFDPDDDIVFEGWYSRYEDLFDRDAEKLTDDAKVRLLMRKLSIHCHDKYVNFILPKSPRDFNFMQTVEQLKKLFGKKRSLFSARYHCLQTTKNGSDDFVTYGAKVNKVCEDFKISSLAVDEFKSLIFVIGLKDQKEADIRSRLLQKIETSESTTVASLVDECQNIISLRKDANLIGRVKLEDKTESNVNKMEFTNRKYHRQRPEQNAKAESQGQAKQSEKNDKPRFPCWFCGLMHFSKNCTYSKHECKQCGQIGHKEGYAKCGQASSGNHQSGKPKSKTGDPKSSTVNAVFEVNVLDIKSNRKFVKVSINGKNVSLQLDTGADVTVISKQTWEQIGKPKMHKTNHIIKCATKRKLELLGEINCEISCNGLRKPGICYVTEVQNLNLLGIDWIDKFALGDLPINLICNKIETEDDKVIEIRQKFKTVFQNKLGLCNKMKIELHLKADATPIFRNKRPMALATLPLVEKELRRLESEGAITAVDFSDWAAPIVAVRKSNGKIRICADYSTGLNDSLQPHKHPLPVPEDILCKLAGGIIFSHIDLSDAFLQVEVDERSRKLLTINTHLGLFAFNRLPAGVKPAPNAFQKVMDSMLAGLDGVAAYIDDIIVSGTSVADHREKLERVLQRIADYGFQLKFEKCKFFMKELKYLGYVINQQGLKPDPDKIKAIVNMPAPHDKTTLRSFLGSVVQYGKFVDKLRHLRGPLDELLKNDSEWNWSNKCNDSFVKLKEHLQSNIALMHFDPNLDIIVAADACEYGLGAVLMHNCDDGTRKAVYYASRSLNSSERKYSQIEKEALALIFAVTKFHKFIYGRKFLLQTDHKPLLAIFGSKKGIPAHSANRIQRWALIMLQYNFIIEYVNTNSFAYADVLSRLINEHDNQDEDFIIASAGIDNEINYVFNDNIKNLPIKYSELANETDNDNTLQTVIDYMENGWPNVKSIKDDKVRKFNSRKDALERYEKCIMFNSRIVIPERLQKRILIQLHKGHPGRERMKSLARSYVYWPNIDVDVENFVKGCENCVTALKMPVKTSLSSWRMSTKPFERVHLDFAGPVQGEMFLLIVDSYTKWPEIFQMKSVTASATIAKLREVFARFGSPELLVTDNGTQFTSHQFKQFCELNGCEHMTTAPYHPQSNGQAERFVDTFKTALKKLKEEEKIADIVQDFLYAYRSTPNRSLPDNQTPAELMIGRKMRLSFDLLKPPMKHSSIENTKQNNQYNIKHGARKRHFNVGDLVHAKVYSKNGSEWKDGEIVKRVGKVMYHCQLNNKLIRVHANQIRTRYHETTANNGNDYIPFNVLLDEFGFIQDQCTVPNESSSDQSLPTPASTSVQDPSSLPTPASTTVQNSSSLPTPGSTTVQQSSTVDNQQSDDINNNDETTPVGRPVRVKQLPRRLASYFLY